MIKNRLLCLAFLMTFSIGKSLAQNNYEIVTKINTPNPDPSGIAVASDGTVYLGFPRHADNHTSFALAKLVDGNLIPWPSKDFVLPSQKPYKDWLVSPHGIFMDKNDILWVLDDGKRAGIKEIPAGAAKVVAIDTKTGNILYNLVIPPDVMNSSMHLNDLRVDLTHGKEGTVFIANSGFGEHYSLLVVDVATGKSREVLVNHISTSPENGFMGFLEGKPHVYDPQKPTFPIGGADGITLSSDSKTLYWTAITGHNLYSIPTEVIADFSKSDYYIQNQVHFEGEHPACDGIASDENGNLYFGSFEQQSIVQRDSKGMYHLLAHDAENFVWPDGLAYQKGYIYVTLGQWNRLAGFNDGHDLRKPPYWVVKISVNRNEGGK